VDAQVTLLAGSFGLAVPFEARIFYAEPGLCEHHGDERRRGAAGSRTMTSALVVREKDLAAGHQVAVTDGCAAAIVADPQSERHLAHDL